MPGGDLIGVIGRHPDMELTIEEIRFYSACCIIGLEAIHNLGYVWRALKPENVLIDAHGFGVLTDGSASKKLSTAEMMSPGLMMRTYTCIGTPEYLAPEILFGRGHGVAVDWWSLGIMIHELFAGVTPFSPRGDETTTDIYTNIAKGVRQITDWHLIHNRAAQDLIRLLLAERPQDRLGMLSKGSLGITNHVFFNTMSFDILRSRDLTCRPMELFVPSPSDTNGQNFTDAPVPDYDEDASFDGISKVYWWDSF